MGWIMLTNARWIEAAELIGDNRGFVHQQPTTMGSADYLSRQPSNRSPPLHQSIRSVDCHVDRCWYGRSKRGGRSSLTPPRRDTTIAAPKMDAMKPPTLCLPRRTLLGPMHYDSCAIYWVPRCVRCCAHTKTKSTSNASIHLATLMFLLFTRSNLGMA